MPVSKEFIRRVKLFPSRQYKLAHKAGVLPSTLSKITNGIDIVKPGDPRVVRVGKILSLSPAECFEEKGEG